MHETESKRRFKKKYNIVTIFFMLYLSLITTFKILFTSKKNSVSVQITSEIVCDEV